MGLAKLPPKIEPGYYTRMYMRAVELIKAGKPGELAFAQARDESELQGNLELETEPQEYLSLEGLPW